MSQWTTEVNQRRVCKMCGCNLRADQLEFCSFICYLDHRKTIEGPIAPKEEE